METACPNDKSNSSKILIVRFKVHFFIFLSQRDPSVALHSSSVSLTSYHTVNSKAISVSHVLQKAGADPGGRGLGGQDTPFWGTPKLHKEGKNAACMHANATCFSS